MIKKRPKKKGLRMDISYIVNESVSMQRKFQIYLININIPITNNNFVYTKKRSFHPQRNRKTSFSFVIRLDTALKHTAQGNQSPTTISLYNHSKNQKGR